MLNETIAKEDEIKYMKSPLSERTLAEYKPMGSAAAVTYYTTRTRKSKTKKPP